jgi:hypothetical protein
VKSHIGGTERFGRQPTILRPHPGWLSPDQVSTERADSCPPVVDEFDIRRLSSHEVIREPIEADPRPPKSRPRPNAQAQTTPLRRGNHARTHTLNENICCGRHQLRADDEVSLPVMVAFTGLAMAI